MAESENDSLSVEDLLAAFGSSSPSPKTESKSSTRSSKSSDVPSMTEDELDLLSALGITSSDIDVASSTSKRPAKQSSKQSAVESAVNYDRDQRESFKSAARREQQIRAQQWQQELRRREMRLARMQNENDASSGENMRAVASSASVGSVATGYDDLPFTEEGGLSKKPATSAIADSKVSGDGFAQPWSQPREELREQLQEYQSHQIAEPSFMRPKENPSSFTAQASNVSSLPDFKQMPALQPFTSVVSSAPSTDSVSATDVAANTVTAMNAGATVDAVTDVAETAAVTAAAVTKDSIVDAVQASTTNAAQTSTVDATENANTNPATSSANQGVIKRSFLSTPSSISSIQRLDEVGHPTVNADQESFVERKQIPLSASTDALSTGVLGSIQPVPGSQVGVMPQFGGMPFSGAEQLSGVASEQYQSQGVQPFENGMQYPQDEVADQAMQTAQTMQSVQAGQAAAQVSPEQAAAQGVQPAQALSATNDQFAAVAATPTSMQPNAPFASEPMNTPANAPAESLDVSADAGHQIDQQVDYQFGQQAAQQPDQPINQQTQQADQFASPSDQETFASQPQPMYNGQPVSIVPVSVPPDDSLDYQKQSASSRRNNILGIILIVVALLCAIMAIGMLSGLFNMNAAGDVSASSSAASASASASDASSDSNTSEAVYTYVIRGVDGTTHEATETATFNADGYLEGSTIEIQVSDADTANSLLEQLKSEFGSSVVNSEANESHVLIDLDINREDLTKEAYTELLLANMTEFKQIS